MYQRKIYQQMLEWKTRSQGTSALLIEGARRTGKTTIAREFANREYAAHIYIDFGHVDKQVTDLFLEYRSDTPALLRMLQLYYQVQLPERNGLIIFDEVQRFPIAREEVKHLVADGRFDYLETGSLVSIKKSTEKIVIPSEEEAIRLNPMNFEEYLWATDRKLLADELRSCKDDLRPLPDTIHSQANRFFNEYLMVGGMPQAVSAFAGEGNFAACDRAKRAILRLYDEDIQKFGGRSADAARGIWRQIPSNLSAQSKRFKFSTVSKSARYANHVTALNWLEDSRTINLCRRCNDPNAGFKLAEEPERFKCYMADTGLLVSQAFGSGPGVMRAYRDLQFGKLSINRGMIVENAMAQQLAASGHELFFYTWNEPPKDDDAKRSREREIDFLLPLGFENAAGKLRVSPVEAKSGKRYTTVSLDDFEKKFSKRVGTSYVLHPKQLRVEEGRVFLPLYMAHLL